MLLALGLMDSGRLLARQGSTESQSAMKGSKTRVVYLNQRDPDEALERLNRITGLSFSSWPQSLCTDNQRGVEAPESNGELLAVDVAPEVVSG
jgi:hypothetical protein